MKKQFFIATSVFLVSIFLSLNVWAAGEGGPVALLQSIADQMIASLKSHKTSLKTNPSLVYSLATRIIVPHADLNAMSKRVLPPATWNNATPSQRSQFKNEFTTLLVRTYASALAEYTDQTIRFYPVRGGYQGKSSVRVDSQIVRTDGPSIEVSYRLFLRGSQWMLIDMTVEGVSLLESFRSQFADKLAQGDMNNLIRELSQHNTNHSGNG